jgi:nucleotide-binding universal stress UspA family protein
MKILIGYDGLPASDAALYDLQTAGLPTNTEAIILTAAGGWLSSHTDKEAEILAERGCEKLRLMFPNWSVGARTGRGVPAAQILRFAEEFSPDLIVVGEQRHSLSERNMFLGSVANDVLTEAKCSVRIARGMADESRTPPVNVIGFDGSAPATCSVDAVASRKWREGSEVRLVVVADTTIVSAVGRFTPQISNGTVEKKAVTQWADALCAAPLAALKKSGLNASLHLEFGNAKDVIIRRAEEWDATSIFMGPHCSGNSFERFLLGSVSTAVAARAHCSVEIIR